MILKGAWQKNKDRALIERFFTHLAVCHTVMAKPKVGAADDEVFLSKISVVKYFFCCCQLFFLRLFDIVI